MHPADLTPVEIAALLAEAYAHGQGFSLDGPASAERPATANHLDCHDEVRVEVWEL